MNIEIKAAKQTLGIEQLPNSEQNIGVILLCHTGNARLDYFGTEHTLRSRNTILLFPADRYRLSSATKDFSFSWVTFNANVANLVMDGFGVEFREYINAHPIYNITDNGQYNTLMRYIDLLSLKSADSQNLCRSQILVSLLRALLLEMLAQVENMRRTTSIDVKQKGVILDQFIAAVKATPRCREVAYFAERLSISPKQLSAIVGDGTGFSAKEFIDRNAIDVIKHLLRTTDLSVKDIAEQLNYTGSGNLCRFFKTRTGLTISEYKQH